MLFFNRPLVGLVLVGLVLAVLSGPVIAASTAANSTAGVSALTLEEAIGIAVKRDAVLAQRLSQAQAMRETAVASGELPDPTVSLGVMNVPTDSFALDAEPMTQVTLGVSQQFLAGDSADLREVRGMQRAQGFTARALERRLSVVRSVRELWFKLRYTQQALDFARAGREAAAALIDLLSARYASGAVSQQALLRARLQLGAFTEKVLQLEAELQSLRGLLVRWVGPELAQQTLTYAFSDVPAPIPYQNLLQQLPDHPLLAVQRAAIDASQTTQALAEEAYEPSWTLSLQYGARQGYSPLSNRPNSDVVSAMVSMSLPLFADDRQDRNAAAARSETQAARFAWENQLRQLRAQLEAAWAQWIRYSELETLYKTDLIPAALARVEAARSAYENSAGDIDTLIEARLGALETQTNAARISRKRATAQAVLLYLAGEKS
ncbi:MAG TPA: TolC family protein [Gammaproteobacteria bacterium]|nr:TolC family protein [Gammaproteobacteria bacterium]